MRASAVLKPLVNWLKCCCTFTSFFGTGCCAAELCATPFSVAEGFSTAGFVAGDFAFWLGVGWLFLAPKSSGTSLWGLLCGAGCCAADVKAKAAIAQQNSVHLMREREGFMQAPVCVAVFSHPMS